jgi:hypothetical protein
MQQKGELKMAIMSLIPAYPQEIGIDELARKVGMESWKLKSKIANVGSIDMLCEDDGKLCFLDEKSRRRALGGQG